MSIIDFAILGVFGLFILIGYHQGFLKAVLNFCNFFISLLGAWWLHSGLAKSFQSVVKISDIIYYSESAEMLKSVENMRLVVSDLTPARLNEILSQLSLPHPLNKLLMHNVTNQVFADLNIVNLRDYLSMTIAHMAINIISFLVVFIIFYLIIALIINLSDYVFKLPVLKYLDNVGGSILGFLQGMMLLFVVFTIVPVILAFIPFDEIRNIIEGSNFARFYYHSNFIIDMIKGVIQ